MTPPKSGAQELHGRKVEVYPLSELAKQDTTYKCADCPEPPEYVVIEKESKRNQAWMPTVWYWCGKCDIGG
jgi:hypothetical protein